jgi:hypothetical protein
LNKADKIIWGKMLIEVYKELDDLIRVLELRVLDDCCNSNNYYTNYESTEKQCVSIIDLILRTDNLKLLKQNIGESLKKLDKTSKYIIVCKDFNKKLRKEVIAKLEYTTKFYRLYENALNSLFDAFFNYVGMDTFIEKYSNENLVKRCMEKACRFNLKRPITYDANIALLLGIKSLAL